uniref:Uncharacterized protein n=1 Tax=Prochlorococcus marinus str. P0903-H212 TaxID=1622208 RepID=A0A0D5A4K3_PROMR|nr:hypothetical protein FA03_0280 [Prochlorococcus marinus str. P0903-H212]
MSILLVRYPELIHTCEFHGMLHLKLFPVWSVGLVCLIKFLLI